MGVWVRCLRLDGMQWKAYTMEHKTKTENDSSSHSVRQCYAQTRVTGKDDRTYLIVHVGAVQMMGVQSGRNSVGAQFRVPKY